MRRDTASRQKVLRRLIAVAGEAAVMPGAAGAAFFTDVYKRGEEPLAVVRPTSVAMLQDVIRTAVTAGVAVFPRGSGASYSDGYLPTRRAAILLDLGGLDRIVEINEPGGW